MSTHPPGAPPPPPPPPPPPTGPGRISDRALTNLFTAIPIALGAVLAVVVAVSGGAS
jgi:hypothetical protein